MSESDGNDPGKAYTRMPAGALYDQHEGIVTQWMGSPERLARIAPTGDRMQGTKTGAIPKKLCSSV